VQVIARAHADISTLAVLRELGMPLSLRSCAVGTFANAAALNQRTALRNTHITGSLHYAAYSGNTSMLEWLKE
jgi:hypothetical protein